MHQKYKYLLVDCLYIVKWSSVATKLCPMLNCTDDETVEHPLIQCQRTRDAAGKASVKSKSMCGWEGVVWTSPHSVMTQP